MITTLMLFLATSSAVSISDDEKARVNTALTKMNIQAKTIEQSPIPGLYLIETPHGVMYVDKTVTYLVSGQITNLQKQVNETEAWTNKKYQVDFKSLPFKSAISVKVGKGERQIALFEDPNCQYCKKLRQTLAEIENITIHVFQYNILSPDSFAKSKNIWCASNRATALNNWMLKGVMPEPAKESCQYSDQEVKAMAEKYHFRGVPVLVFQDGSRIPGAAGKDAIEKRLASLANR